MPDNSVIKPFLEAHKAEVKGMLMEEYNEAEVQELFKEEGRAEGRVDDIHSLMKTLKLSAQQAMEALQIPLSEQPYYMKML